MKVIPKLQQGNTIESDNTKVVRPEIHEPIKAKPRQYSIVDLGGEPSNDTRSAAERNRDYWHPIKGAKARFRASMSNETNPLVGIERTILPSAAGAALVTTPAAVVGGALGNMTVDKLTGGWGNWLEDKTGIPSEIGVYTNPGAWYGGAKGYKIGKDKLITKSIKGDADLAWNPINKNHWVFNKEARTPTNLVMAATNRVAPFLNKVEKLPLKVAAYKAAKRTNGKRDMRKKFIKSSRPTSKKRIKKAQQGMRFVSYNPVSNPTIDYTDITNPINPFSEYNYNTTYDKPEALVVPVRDTDETDVANNPTVEPVINKPVASKPVTNKPVTANSTWKSPYTNRKQWATELINAYKKAGITNDNAIRMLLAQDALESSWGKSAQGKYNFGNLTTGSSWKGDYVTGNDKNAKGEAIKQKFRSYNSMDEYAADKIQFLKRLYDFDENDDINKFVAKLTGSNKGKRRYAEAKEYANSLRGVYNSFKAGGIIKYQEPAQPIKYMGGYDKRGNIVLPVNNENGMNNVTLPEVTVTPRNINLAGAVDRGRREAAPYISTLLTGAIFGPRQSIHVVHDKNSAGFPKLHFPERWDAVNEGAPEVGIWYQGKFGNPRTAANHSIPGKAEKAAKARERFAKRPYRVEGDLELERPIVTVGDVPNRAALERAADKMSADGVIFNNVYDNGYSNNQVIFSLRDDLKNGRVFKKGAKPKVDAYYPSKVYKRTVDDVNRDYLNFIEYIDNSETMQKLADIDKELGTQYVKAVTDFKEAAKQGKLRVKSPKPGTLDIQGYPIRNPQTLTHPDIMKNPSYDYIDIDILADFPPNSVGHEFKHAIENYQAALSGIKGSVDDALFANPRLQALMKDNIVSEDEFVASMVKRYPKNDIKEIRKVYKYLTDPGEFNAQLHPLIELEQRAGKSGLPNFKDADAVNQVIKQGRASGHGGSHLDILFNNLLKPDKREEFVKQFNKYGWSLAAPAIINNRE